MRGRCAPPPRAAPTGRALHRVPSRALPGSRRARRRSPWGAEFQPAPPDPSTGSGRRTVVLGHLLELDSVCAFVDEDHDDDTQTEGGSEPKFRGGHREAPVANHGDHGPIRKGVLCSDGRREPESHRRETVGHEDAPRLVCGPALPHQQLVGAGHLPVRPCSMGSARTASTTSVGLSRPATRPA